MWDHPESIPHNDSPSGAGDAHHLPGDIKRLWRKHGPKHADDEIERIILQFVQIGCVAFLKPAVREACLPGADVAGRNEVRCNIDAQDIGSEPCLRQAVVPSPHPRSSTLSPFVIPRLLTKASPLSRMLAEMRVKSPFSHSALFGFIETLLLCR